MRSAPDREAPAFLVGGGAMGALVRAHDWAATPLGPPDDWPPSLRTAVAMVLNSGFPAALVWGPGLVTIYNDAFRCILGQKPEALGRSFAEVWSEAWAEIGAIAERALQGEATYIEDFPLTSERNGYPEQAYFTFCYSPVRDEAGEVVGFLDTVVETTERIRAEAATQSSEAKYRALIEASASTVWTTDAEGRVLEDSPSWRASTGQSLGEWLGSGWLDAVHPDDRAQASQNWAESVAGVRPVETEVRLRHAASGSWRLTRVRAVPLRGPDGLVASWVGMSVDVEDERRAESALAESEGRLRFLSELDEALRTSGDAPAAMEAAAGLLARRLGASRCAYADVDADSDRFIIRRDYTARGIATSAGTYSLDLFGPRAAADMRAGRTLVVRDVSGELAPKEGAETFQAIGVRAIVCCPLVKEGALVAMMAVHQDRPRDWRDDEIRLVEAVVERCWAHVQRVGAEARMRESESKFEAIANSIDQMIWSTRPDGYHDYYNDRWYEYTGVPYGSTDGEAWKGMFHPDDQEQAWGVWRHSLETGDPYHIEYRLRHRSGQYRWVIGRAQCIRDDAGRIGRWYGTCTDVHDLKVAEERLRELNDTLEGRVAERTGELAESQRRFRAIFDSALQFMALLTPAGTVVEVNRTALEWSQITPVDIVGNPFWLAAPMRGNPELQAAVKAGIRRAAAGETVRAEHEMRGAGEVRAFVDFSIKPVPGERGEPMWLVAEGRDITELKRAQDALRQAQKLEAVGQLTGGVAHDFNNLLTIIKSSTDLLRKPGLAEERRRRYVDAIADTVDRASKLTGQLLAFARRQALKPEVFDPAQRVRSITDMLRTIVGAPIQIAIEIHCQDCHVEADASQFETALVNMAVNARDAMNGEGRLTVRVDEVSAMPALRGHLGGPGRFVTISLTDTGCGIPPEKLSHIFEPFFTTKEVGKGTGLGLSQVFGFAKQSGGDVAVQSQEGQGTTFTLYLPRVEGDEARDGADGEQRAGAIDEHGHGRRILVVEDNVDVGRFSTQILHDLGYVTTWAANGDEALKVLSELNEFDAVFSDVVMPGISGVELGQEIRRRYPGLPVVLTSGYSHVLAEEGRHGFELIQKPYAVEELSRVLRRVTRDSQARP